MTARFRSTTYARLRSTAHFVALATLLLIFPTIAHAMPVVVGPPPPPASVDDAGGDDLFLLQSAVSPNVVLFLDNSQSMNQIEWHPAFDPDKVPDGTYCSISSDFDDAKNPGGVLDPDAENIVNGTLNNQSCDTPNRGNRKVYGPNSPTYWSGRYLMWYLGLDAGDATDAAILNEIATQDADVDGCTQAGGSGAFADMYRRTRFEASKQVLLDLLCLAEPKNVRFGSAAFREADDAAGVDPNGGFVSEDLGRSNPNHAAQLEASLKNENVRDTDGTPLAETLFQIYTYWMPRVAADMPLGENGNPFPIYEYKKNGSRVGSNQWFEDTMIYDCEKAFVIIVTDGAPTRDTFDEVDASDPADTALGYADFGTGGALGLIGDYYVDGEIEEPGDADESSFYLDDIAKYMYDKDFRPDLAGNQTIDTYVVGFATGGAANPTNVFLQRVADLGNGTFYRAKDGDELVAVLVAALNDIIEKAASFTAATVPSARTADGADFYQSYFFPRSKSAFWEGHIRAWTIDAVGNILDADDNCALDDPTVGECNSGPFLPSARYHWDAAEEMPLPAARTLYVSKAGAMTTFDATLTAVDLDVDVFAAPPAQLPNDPGFVIKGSTAVSEEGLADEVVEFVRGCFFGTGVLTAEVASPMACEERPARLGDVFHSNAIAIRQPSLRSNDPSYLDFKTHYAGRDRLLYAGSNGGFLEAFDTGSWLTPNPATGKDGYDRGTGIELFGFMPWEARLKIKQLVIDDPTDRNNYVDGDVNSADVWIDAGLKDGAKTGDEWHTYLLGALREGGHHYYALDVTNPNQITEFGGGGGTIPFPDYAWEYPPEGSTDIDYMGETWAKPIITKVWLNVFGGPVGAVEERWVAIVTGGYDKSSDPNPDSVTGITSTYNTAPLKGRGVFIIDIASGEVLAEKRFASATDPQAAMTYSVVGTPSVLDINFDGFADLIYVGDMGGNIWKWAIHNPGEDRITEGLGNRTQPNWPFKKFFEANPGATGGVDYFKNFMFPPAAAYKDGILYIAFGSGERRNLTYGGDAGDTADNNRFYVIIESDPYEVAALATLDEADLTDFSASAAAQTFANKGFYITLIDGEKFVTNVEIFNGKVIVASFIPTVDPDPCATRGEGTLYVFDLQTGQGHFDDGSGGSQRWLALGAGLPTDPKVSIGVGGKDNKVIIEKSGSDIEIIDTDNLNLNGATLYWREND